MKNTTDVMVILEEAKKHVADVDNFIASLQPREQHSGRPNLSYFRFDRQYCQFVRDKEAEDPDYDCEYLNEQYKRHTIGAYVQASSKYDEELVANGRTEETAWRQTAKARARWEQAWNEKRKGTSISVERTASS